MLASKAPNTVEDLEDLSDEAVQRFLKWIENPAQRQALLDLALPRYLDLDVVSALVGADRAEEAFRFVTSMDFISRAGNGKWVYHATVREQMLRYRRKESWRRWQEEHSKLADFYAAEGNRLQLSLPPGSSDPLWEQLYVEWLYHSICVHATGATALWLESLLEGYEPYALYDFEENSYLGEVVEQAGLALDNESIIHWGKLIKQGILAGTLKQMADTVPLVEAVAKTASEVLDTQLQALALHWLARTRYELNDIEGEIEAFTQALALLPDAGTYWLRSRAYFNLGKRDAARKDMDCAIEMDSSQEVYFRWRGHIQRLACQYAGAIADFTRAIELGDPSQAHSQILADSYWGRGVSYHALGRLEDSLTDLDRAIDLCELDEYYESRGRLRHAQKQDLDAVRDYSRGIELNPEEARFYSLRASVSYALGDIAGALQDYKKALELAPENAAYFGPCGWLCWQSGRCREAISYYTRAIELQPRVATYRGNRARVYASMRDHGSALADLSIAHHLEPENEEFLSVRAMAYLDWGRNKEALHDINRSIELYEDKSSMYHYYYWRALVYLGERNFEAALADLNADHEFYQDEATYHNIWHAVILQAQGRDQEASTKLEEADRLAAKIDPAVKRTRTFALLRLLRKEPEEARRQFEDLLATSRLDELENPSLYLRILCQLFPDREDIRDIKIWFEGRVSDICQTF